MEALIRMTLILVILPILCLSVSVQGTLVNDESPEDRYLKRSLCNTFGGCSGLDTGLRFTGRSFSEKVETGRSPAQARAPYSFRDPNRAQYATSIYQLAAQADDLRELPPGWNNIDRGYLANNKYPSGAYDNNIR